jgi:hypothetical protein
MKKALSTEDKSSILSLLKTRFEKQMQWHKAIEWTEVQTKLESNNDKLWSLWQMEVTGGEPELVEYLKESDEYVFCDCSPESPSGRRSLCYDDEALNARKENKPKGSALQMAFEMGVELLNEKEYRKLQEFKHLDSKTSSWLQTPADVRKLGGAIFGDFRYDRVFIYHNGVQSYYAARGFRGILIV